MATATRYISTGVTTECRGWCEMSLLRGVMTGKKQLPMYTLSLIIFAMLLCPWADCEPYPTLMAVADGEHYWPSLQHDSQRTSRSGFAGPTAPSVEWEQTVDLAWPFGNVVVSSDGTLYWTNWNNELCAMGADGTDRWRIQVPASVSLGTAPVLGPLGDVYLAAVDGVRVFGTDGSMRGRIETSVCPCGMALSDSGTLYVVGEGVSAVDLNSSNERWFYPLDGYVVGGPTIGTNGDVYVTLSHSMHAISSEGAQKWQMSSDNAPYCLHGHPVVGADGTIYVVDEHHECLRAVRPDGTQEWSVGIQMASDTTSPALGPDGTIYIVGRELHELQAIGRTGTQLWSFSTPVCSFQGPPAIDSQGRVLIVGSSSWYGELRWLFAIRPDGTEDWRFRFPDDEYPHRYPVVVGGENTLYVLSSGQGSDLIRRIGDSCDGNTEYWAIVVGVDSEDSLLGGPEANGEHMTQALLSGRNWRPDHIHSLIGDEATRDALSSAVHDLVAKMDGDDVFFFYFTGHGGRGLDHDEEEPDGREGYLCLASGTTMRDDALSGLFAEIPAREFFAAIGSCYSGEHIKGARQVMAPPSSERSVMPCDLDDLGRGIIITSVPEDETDVTFMGHAGFSSIIAKGFRGLADLDADGWITAYEVVEYALDRWSGTQVHRASADFRLLELPAESFSHLFDGGQQMVGFPCEVLRPSTIEETTGCERAARWDADEQGYVEVTGPAEMVSLGEGCWADFDSEQTVSITGTSFDGDTFRRPLEPSWNIVALPWNEALPISAMSSEPAGEVLPHAWTYYDNDYHLVAPIDGIPGLLTELEPWRSYWTYASSACEIILDRTAAPSALQPASVGDTAARDIWAIQLTAAAGGSADTANYCGVSPNASALHIQNPPVAPNGVDLYFPSEGGGRRAFDFVSTCAGDAMEWDFESVAPSDVGEVTVSCPDLSSIPSDRKVYLVDKDADRAVYLRTTRSYTYRPSSDTPRHFVLCIVKEEDGAAVVSGLTAQQASTAACSLTYALSRAANVMIDVFNIAGRRVRRLPQRELRTAGIQTAVWDLRAENGRPVPSGMFLVRVTARTEDGQQASALTTLTVHR